MTMANIKDTLAQNPTTARPYIRDCIMLIQADQHVSMLARQLTGIATSTIIAPRAYIKAIIMNAFNAVQNQWLSTT